jgi:hypothetical protein
MTETVRLGDIFTNAEMKQARKLFLQCRKDGTRFNDCVVTQIVEPAMPRINAVTGQENVARYWGYMLECALICTS